MQVPFTAGPEASQLLLPVPPRQCHISAGDGDEGSGSDSGEPSAAGAAATAAVGMMLRVGARPCSRYTLKTHVNMFRHVAICTMP